MYFYAVIGMELMGGDVQALSSFPSAMYMMIKLLFAVDYLESVADCEKSSVAASFDTPSHAPSCMQ